MNLFNLINIPTNMQPTPSTFNEGFSYYETVSKLIMLVNQMITQVNENTDEEQALKSKYEDLLLVLINLQSDLDKYKNGQLIPDGSISLTKMNPDIFNQINEYIKKYMYDMNKFVTFGLEDDKLVAYIPETWEDITFSTDADGHLILEF